MKFVSSFLPLKVKQAIRNRICGAKDPSRSEPGTSALLSPVMARLPCANNPCLYVLPGDIISDSILATGIWEPELSTAILEDAARGGLMVEVGANLGYFSILWACASENNRVLAFEPSLRNISFFQQSVIENHLSDRIIVLPVAAGADISLSTFELGPEQQTGWGGIVPETARSSTLTRVVVLPLDSLLNDVPVIDVLKIDVEGADTLVLQGCAELLSRGRIKKIYYEQNQPRMSLLGVDPGTAQKLLNDFGYQARPMSELDKDVVQWTAWPAQG